jgi:hypothetical protein
MTEASTASVVHALSAHPHAEQMASLVRDAALQSAGERDPRFLAPGHSTPLPEGHALSAEQTETELGNLLEVFERGATTAAERKLVGALLALGVANQLPSAPESELALAASLVWLAAHTPCNALGAVDAALGEQAGLLWRDVARTARSAGGAATDLDTGEVLVAAAALRASGAEAARSAVDELRQSDEPLLCSVLGAAGDRSSADQLTGELTAAPRGPVATTLLALSGLLFIAAGARAVARFALAYRRPTRLRLSDRGLELEQCTELLGRRLRDRETFVPMQNLARVSREVRFARAGLYAGLLALVAGTYFGMALFVDGLRVPGGSLSLIGTGTLVIVLGLLIDFALSALSDTAKGRCRLIIVPEKGRALCIGRVDTERTDALLEEVRKRLA